MHRYDTHKYKDENSLRPQELEVYGARRHTPVIPEFWSYSKEATSSRLALAT